MITTFNYDDSEYMIFIKNKRLINEKDIFGQNSKINQN
jgi:hypothetical protein